MSRQPRGFEEFPRTALNQSLVACFEATAERFADRLAVQADATQLTYAELNVRANRLARVIAQHAHAGPTPIVILIDSAALQIVATLAILKAGHFYVPLEPGDPPGRLRTLLDDAQPAVVVCDAAAAERAQQAVLSSSGPKLVEVEAATLATHLESGNLGITIPVDALASMAYTSGSTGRPKGVLQTHLNLMHTVWASANRLYQVADDRMALLSPLSVGVSAAMLFGGLLIGAAVLPFNVRRHGIARLARWLVDERVSVTYSLPSVMRNTLLLLQEDQRLADLRIVKMGGEPLFRSDLALFRKHLLPGTLVQHTLGTTETHAITFTHLDLNSTPSTAVLPVGYPEQDLEVLLLDEAAQPVPAGEVGEIVVRGEYLSPGYWRQPVATAAAFSHLGGRRREYRTGDLGRLLPDGSLEHLGRQDAVVKVRGHLVSLTEVETALRELPMIAEAAVVGHEDAPGRKRLVAYLVPTPGAQAEPGAVREALAANLPDHLLPATCVVLERLPLLPNGKVDTRALPREGAPTSSRAPQTPLESLLCGIWAEVLQRPVGVDDEFAALGGDSLVAAQILARLNAACQVELPFTVLYEAPTVAQLARVVSQHLTARTDAADLASLLDEVETLSEAAAEAELRSASRG